jgi:hypothetical protein
MNTVTQAKQRHEPPAQPTALEPQKTSRGDAADEATERRETILWERCPVCGYRAIPRDGLLIHEAAALTGSEVARICEGELSLGERSATS